MGSEMCIRDRSWMTTHILSKRRFFLAHGDSGNDLTRKIPMDYLIHSTIPGQPDLVVEVPYGTNIFPKSGESKKYMHGGDALQEVVIPIIQIENKKKDRAKNRANQATVKLISISRKVTSLITFLEFFQNEQVDDKTVPCNYEAYFVDSNNEQITNSIVINCDSKRIWQTEPIRRSLPLKTRSTVQRISII